MSDQAAPAMRPGDRLREFADQHLYAEPAARDEVLALADEYDSIAAAVREATLTEALSAISRAPGEPLDESNDAIGNYEAGQLDALDAVRALRDQKEV